VGIAPGGVTRQGMCYGKKTLRFGRAFVQCISAMMHRDIPVKEALPTLHEIMHYLLLPFHGLCGKYFQTGNIFL
jgi:hypothetical protein